MKFAVIGSGAVGSYYAGVLKRADNMVYLLSRGKSMESISNNGLKVITDEEEFVVHPDITSNRADDFPKVEAVIVAVKTWQVRDILPEISKLLDPETVIIPMQNGVDAYPILKEYFPENATGGITRLICYVESPGTVKQVGFRPFLAFGRDDGRVSPLMENVNISFLKAGIRSKISKDILKDIWTKFLIMATFGGVGSVTQSPIGVMRSVEETRQLMDSCMDEVIAVSRSMKINLGQDDKYAASEWFKELPFDSTSSTQRDIHSGKPSEILDLTGAVIRLGTQHSIEVPVNRFIYASLLPQELRARGSIEF
ncbi:MAG: ketopantoate reductase family protein [Thermoplasmata archaeon]